MKNVKKEIIELLAFCRSPLSLLISDKPLFKDTKFSTQSNDTTETLASRLIKTLSFDENAGLYVFDRCDSKWKEQSRCTQTEEKHFQCVVAVYRGEGDKVWMRLVTRSLEGVCHYCYCMCQRYKIQDKGKPAQLKWKKPFRI